MNIFQTLTAGDSARWHDDPWIATPSGDRLTSTDWTLTYQLRGATQLTLTAVADGDGWSTSLGITDSQTLEPGVYVWGAYLSQPDERITIGGGTLTIKADPATITTPIDGRSVAQKALADAEAALADLYASGKKTKKYMIGNRSAEYYTAADLLGAITYWKRRVLNECGDTGKLLVRF